MESSVLTAGRKRFAAFYPYLALRVMEAHNPTWMPSDKAAAWVEIKFPDSVLSNAVFGDHAAFEKTTLISAWV